MTIYDRFGYPIQSGSGGLPATLTQGVSFDGGGSALIAPLSFPLIVPQDCEIVKVVVLTEGGPGDCVLDILKAPFGSYPPTASICASDLPTITADIDYMDSTLTGWTTALDADDTLLVNLTTTDTFTQITMTLYLQTLVGGDDGSPLTTKGDLYTYDTGNTRLGVGANSTLLVADSTQPTGLNWKPPGTTTYFGSGAPSTLHNTGDIYFDTSITPVQGYVQIPSIGPDIWALFI